MENAFSTKKGYLKDVTVVEIEYFLGSVDNHPFSKSSRIHKGGF